MCYDSVANGAMMKLIFGLKRVTRNRRQRNIQGNNSLEGYDFAHECL